MRPTRILSLFSIPLALCLVVLTQPGVAQLPARTKPPVPSDPTVPPPLPPTDPRLTAQPTIQPGTIQRDPAVLNAREITYLQPGEAPGQPQVTATGPRSVTLSWSAPEGASGYWVHQAGVGQTTYYRGGSLVTETTTTVNRLLPGTSYSFKVSAVYPQDLRRREGMSEAISATTGAAPMPAGLTASVVGRGQVSLSWDGLPGADGFRLTRNDSTLKDIKPVAYSGGTSLATALGDSVLPGTHRYQIQAVYVVDGAEAVSALAPTPPASVTIQPGTRVRYCQTRATARCAAPNASSITIAANTPLRAEGRKSP